MTDAKDAGRSADFWDAKARTFPRFEEGDANYEAGMLRLAGEQGVDFRGRHILDVGCGSGMYTIRLARQAARVTALDFSAEMLRILRQDAAAQGLANIDYVQSGWMDFLPGRTWDIVFASMTPAVHDDASRRKLLEVAHGWIVYMGWAQRMVSDVMAGLLRAYGLEPKMFNSAVRMREWLVAEGIAHTALPVAGQWNVPWRREELAESCAVSLAAYGVEADKGLIAAHIEAFRDTHGLYRERTDYVIEMILWRNSL